MSSLHSHPFNPDGPLGFFISFRCYGSWLHGDAKGSTHRSGDNQWMAPKIRPNDGLANHEKGLLKHPPIRLNEEARSCIGRTIREVCEFRKWTLHAINVQPDHVHLATGAGAKPEAIMNALKSWSTRRLREQSLFTADRRIWSRHGSTRWLWNEAAIVAVCANIVDGQPWPAELGSPPEDAGEENED